MTWEEQRQNLEDRILVLEENFYYFEDEENDDIRTLLSQIKSSNLKKDSDLSSIKSECEKFEDKLQRIKTIYKYPYYLIKPSTVIKLGDAFRKVLNISSGTTPLMDAINQMASAGGQYQDLYNQYINGTLKGNIYYSQSEPIRGYAFYGFSEITGFSAPYTTGTGTSAFVGCNALTSFYAPLASTYDKGFGKDPLSITHFTAGFNLETVSSGKISYSSWGSIASKHLNPILTKNKIIEMLSLPGVYNVGTEAFADCTALVSVYLDRPDTSVYTLTQAEADKQANKDKKEDEPKEVNVSRSMTMLATSGIGQSAFSGCINLSYVSAPYFRYIKSNAFNGCTSLSVIDFPKAVSVQTQAFMNCPLTEVSLPMCNSLATDAFKKVTTITKLNMGLVSVPNTFNTQTGLSSVIMSAAKSIAEKAFYNLKSLAYVSFPEVTTIQNSAFAGCENIPAFIAPKTTTIYKDVFSECKNLKFVNIADCTKMGTKVFNNCSEMTHIIMPKLVTVGKQAFASCAALTEIYTPVCSSIGENPFADMPNLKRLCIGEDTTTASVFTGCKAIEYIWLPKCKTIGASTFNGFNLSYVSIPECTAIKESAFYDCKMSQIILPKVSTIGNKAFQQCTNLTRVYLLSSKVVTLGTNAFDAPVPGDGISTEDSLNFYVPNALLSTYAAHSTWANYKNFLKGITGTIGNVTIHDRDTSYEQFMYTSDDQSLYEAELGYQQAVDGFNLKTYFYTDDIKTYKDDIKIEPGYTINIDSDKQIFDTVLNSEYYLIENIPVKKGTYRVPKGYGVLLLNSAKEQLYKRENYLQSYINLTNSLNFQFSITTDDCKYITLIFKQSEIDSNDVKLWHIEDFAHKSFFEIQSDNKTLIGPRFVYNYENHTFEVENETRYLYITDKETITDTVGANIQRITFTTPLDLSAENQYFFIDEYKGSQYDPQS